MGNQLFASLRDFVESTTRSSAGAVLSEQLVKLDKSNPIAYNVPTVLRALQLADRGTANLRNLFLFHVNSRPPGRGMSQP
jgi:hypothetical protein